MRRNRNNIFRSGVASLALSSSLAAAPGNASADATDDYPIPNRMLRTTCTRSRSWPLPAMSLRCITSAA